MHLELLIPSFIAGIITFLAPCTLPLVPGYLGFISGVSLNDLKDPEKASRARARILWNGILYVLGFSVVFIGFGTLFTLGGIVLAPYRSILSRLGGFFVIFFGLYMTGILKHVPYIDRLYAGKQPPWARMLVPGKPISSFLFGSAFAFGWTPCVGPVLGTVLFLASTTESLASGILLLAVFSLGLALPFLAIAFLIGSAARILTTITPILHVVSIFGGIFLIALGILLATEMFNAWIVYSFRLFGFLNYQALLEYL